jgi:hypothetical protein
VARVGQKHRHFEVVSVEHKVDVEEEEEEEEEEAEVVAAEGSVFRSWPEKVTTFELSRQRGA